MENNKRFLLVIWLYPLASALATALLRLVYYYFGTVWLLVVASVVIAWLVTAIRNDLKDL